MKKEVPIFIVNGFLESGKTTLIKEIIENNESYHNDTTVVFCTEEGEVEYDEAWCKKYGVVVKTVTEKEEFTQEYIEKIDKEYVADRYVIEYNSFFNLDDQDFPDYMAIYQIITLIDAKTFKIMFNNMKNVFSSMLKFSSLVIFNRCDGVNELANFRRQIRAINQQAQIAFENSDGALTTMLDEDLPYDLKKDTIMFEEDVYPLWYTDVFDNYSKYFNKTIKFKTFVEQVNGKDFVIGRNVMVCCANDIQFLGYEVINETNVTPKKGDCIYLECEVIRDMSKIAGEEVVMLKAKNITILPKEENKVLSF